MATAIDDGVIAAGIKAKTMGMSHAIDGLIKSVRATAASLNAALSSGAKDDYAKARAMLADSARFNLGTPRTTNLPNLPLELLRDDGQERQYVNVDLSQLRWIAPSPAAALVGVANDLAAWGKVVRLLRPHALIETLLRALCLDARVELVRAQS